MAESKQFDDSDDSEVENIWRNQRFGERRRNVNRIIDESDEFESSSEEEQKLDILDESGRFTPSIQRAIRRSIFNLSVQKSDNEDADVNNESLTDKSKRDKKHSKGAHDTESDQSINSDNDDHDADVEREPVNRSHNVDEHEDTYNRSANSTRSLLDTSEDETDVRDLSEYSKHKDKSKRDKKHLKDAQDTESDQSINGDDNPDADAEREVINRSHNIHKHEDTYNRSVNSIRSLLNTSEDENDVCDLSEYSKHKGKLQKKLQISADSSILEVSHVSSDESIKENNRQDEQNHAESINDITYDSSIDHSVASSSAQHNEVSKDPIKTKKSDISSTASEVIRIDSSSEASVNEDEHPEVVQLSIQELQGADIDHRAAQEKVHLTFKLKKILNDLQNMEKVYGDISTRESLPDRGVKLKQTIESHKVEKEKIQMKLTQLNASLKSSVRTPESVASRIRQEVQNESYESIITSPNDSSARTKLDSPDILSLDKPTANDNIEGFGKRAMKTFENQQSLTVERLQVLHGSLLTRPAENEQAADPRGLRTKLMPHQKHALAWLLWRENQKPRGGVLADDMGLGKTLTMISLIMATKEQNYSDDDDNEEWISREKSAKFKGGTLVVCPASLIDQWANEVKNRCKSGELLVEIYHGNNRSSSARLISRNDIVITTYQLLAREFKMGGINAKMFTIEWTRVILDEAHVIRNHKSQTCEAICGLRARKRWALTGTPIHNKELDLYSILKYLRCSPFDDLRVWKRWVDNKNTAGHERLATVMKSLMLRRTKHELTSKGQLETLPEKTLEEIKIDLNPDERLIYQKLLVYSQTLFAQFLSQRAEKEHMFEMGAGRYDRPFFETSHLNTKFNKAQKQLLRQHGEVKSHMILALILRLRQVCCHPSLIHAMLDRDDIEQGGLDGDATSHILSGLNKMKIDDTSANHDDDDDDDGDIGIDDRVRENLLVSDNPVFNESKCSSKLKVILDIVQQVLAKRDKLIIVSQWASYLQIVANHLSSLRGATYKLYTGAVAIKNRQQIVDDFNDPRYDCQILLLSLTAGGVGLNLIGANHLMLIDIHWNPQLESQAQDRIYRFGQKKNVFIYKLICNDTIEERIKNLQEKKQSIAANVLGGSGKVSSKLTMDDLRSLFCM